MILYNAPRRAGKTHYMVHKILKDEHALLLVPSSMHKENIVNEYGNDNETVEYLNKHVYSINQYMQGIHTINKNFQYTKLYMDDVEQCLNMIVGLVWEGTSTVDVRDL